MKGQVPIEYFMTYAWAIVIIAAAIAIIYLYAPMKIGLYTREGCDIAAGFECDKGRVVLKKIDNYNINFSFELQNGLGYNITPNSINFTTREFEQGGYDISNVFSRKSFRNGEVINISYQFSPKGWHVPELGNSYTIKFTMSYEAAGYANLTTAGVITVRLS